MVVTTSRINSDCQCPMQVVYRMAKKQVSRQDASANPTKADQTF